MGDMGFELMSKTVGMFRGAKSMSALASNLGISGNKLVSLVELWDILSTSVGSSSPYENTDYKPSYVNGHTNSSPRKKPTQEISSTPSYSYSKDFSKTTATHNYPVEVYDVDDDEEVEDSHWRTKTDFATTSTSSAENSYNLNNSSIRMLASPTRKSHTTTSGALNKSLNSSSITSPSKFFMDPGNLEIGEFLGNVRNDGITGEFDGYNFAHSKIMTNVSILIYGN